MMAEGRAAQEWAQTSALMTLISNIHRDPKKGKALPPDYFNPFKKLKKRTNKIMKTKDLSILKKVFVDRKLG